MKEKYSPEKYDADEVGFYSRDFFKRTGIKSRPMDIEDGTIVVDNPGLQATRAQKRMRNDRLNVGYEHPTAKGLGEGFKHPLLPVENVEVTLVEWEKLPDEQ